MVDFLIKKYNELDSTQSESKRLIDNGDVHINTVIFTDDQKNGRAKNIRTWDSAKGDLACTIILKPKINILYHPQITYIAAIAVVNTITSFFQNAIVHNKWVNDVMVNERKISGILLESYKDGYLLVGIGVNRLIKSNISVLNAIGLEELGEYPEDFLDVMITEFFSLLEHWENFGFSKIKILWLKHAINIGKEIIIDLNGVHKRGIFLGLDDDGNMRLQYNETIELIAAGDLFI